MSVASIIDRAPLHHTLSAARIARISRALSAACLTLILGLPVAVLIYWLSADATQLAVRANLPATAMHWPLEPWQRVAGALITALPVSLVLLGLWHARRCFKLFAAGSVFTTEAVRCLRRFAGWIAVSVAAGIVASTAISVVLTLPNTPGGRHLAIGVGTDQLFTLLFAAMVWLMAAVIGQGRTLAEENAQFV